jgi:Protein of unknown function (DUF3086)
MNSDGTTNHEPDRTIPTQPPEIIDVRVVEEIFVVPEPLADIWASEEDVVDLSISPPPSSVTPQPPMPDLAQSETTSLIDTTINPISAPENLVTPEDNWDILLNEISQDLEPEDLELAVGGDDATIEPLLRKEAAIKAEIAKLKATKATLQQQIDDTQMSIGQIVQTSIADLEQRRQKLQISVEQLERRRDRIEKEINKSFAGASQDIAIRLQGFKDYLVGSLQDLVVIAEDIEFPQPPPAQIRIQAPIDQPSTTPTTARNQSPQFTEPAFKSTAAKVRASIDRYRTAPDYYAPTWQLRRTLEPVHADKVSEWFFAKDGRGAVRTMGSRLQNILVAATAVSALRELYGDYLRTLVLANLPERLGDWRRGFQDCLGLSKTDFGGNGGIILFEDPEALVQKVDRIVANKEMPLIIIDNSEGQISLSILQYPLWLAFAPDPNQQVDDYREYR